MPRNSASRIVSWPSRARSKTISVTASLGSFALTRGRERVLRELFFLLERLEAALFALRLAIMAGIVLQLEKTASGFELYSPYFVLQGRGAISRRGCGRRSG